MTRRQRRSPAAGSKPSPAPIRAARSRSGGDGQVVFAEAYGAARLDPLEPMTVDTVVDIGSVSKQFTATAILLLAERGLVDLDASLATYLPDLPAWASQPTLAQLLHHQSGIPDHIGLLLDRGTSLTGPSTVADALAALRDVPDLDFVPGSRWEYSNSNYFLLSQVLLAVTGQDLGSFLTDEVFAPLALDMVMDPTLTSDDEAESYERASGEWELADTRWESTIGAGSVHTTPSQLVAWGGAVLGPDHRRCDHQHRATRRRRRRRLRRAVRRGDLRGRRRRRRPSAHPWRTLERVRDRLRGRPGAPRRRRRHVYQSRLEAPAPVPVRRQPARRLDRARLSSGDHRDRARVCSPCPVRAPGAGRDSSSSTVTRSPASSIGARPASRPP